MKKSFSKWDIAHMKTAGIYAQLSSAVRLNVGSVIVKENRIISIGYNGMPSGWDNECEYKEYHPDGSDTAVTKPEVLHAETNAIAKLARSSESGLGATIYVTHAPCMDCAKLIYQSGINKVVYQHDYRNKKGIEFLELCGLEVNQLELKEIIDTESSVG